MRWVLASPGNMAFFENIRDFILARNLEETVEEGRQKKSWQKISAHINRSMAETNHQVLKAALAPGMPDPLADAGQPKPGHSNNREMPSDMFRLIPRTWSKIAAAVIIAFVMGTLASGFQRLLVSTPDEIAAFYSIEAPRGARSTITMADGSKVFLNAGSRVTYAKTYNQLNRDILLEGEGYFVVARNEHIPFRVHTSGIVVEALGTEFNVKAYPEDGRVETTLVKGSVSIARSGLNEQSQPIILKPNQKASVYFDRHEINTVAEKKKSEPGKPLTAISGPVRVRTESNINTETATSWKEARWVFERESMVSLADKLERQYDIQIIFKDEELKQYHLTGTLEEESIEQVLKALQLALPVDFRIEHKHVYLSLNQQRKNSFKHLLK